MTDEVDAALYDAMAAKETYRETGSLEDKAAHRSAAEELRYARWVARGGPQAEAEALDAGTLGAPSEFYFRWQNENGS
jgi:hypothetical protein